MSTLPLARTTMVHAFKQDQQLVVYVEGLTSGFGGKLIVERRPERIFPPLFHVHARPGNDGINPDASPQEMATVAACSFDAAGIPDSILVESLDQRQKVRVIVVKPGATSETSLDADDTVGDTTSADDTVGDAASAPYAAGAPHGEDAGGWTAIHNFMPLGEPRLRVQGSPAMPTPGYKLFLTKASPQGFNPAVLILELETQPPSDNVAQVVTRTPVLYEEVTDQRYTQVTILPLNVTIDVQEVH